MRLGVCVLVGVMAGGCGTTSGHPGTRRPCGGRDGATYAIDFVERSGDCGPIAEQVATPEASSTAQSACTGGATVSADQCDVTLDLSCPLLGNTAGHEVDRGTVHWSDEGSIGVGIISIVDFDGADIVACRSTYDVTYTRQ